MRLESGGSEFGFRPQKTLDINHPPPLRCSRLPKGPPQWARTPEPVQDGTLRRGMRRQEAKETLNQH